MDFYCISSGIDIPSRNVYLLHFSFHSKFVSYPMKANSLCSTYGKRSMLYIIPSHLRILCRTRTRVEGDTCQCCFLRLYCGALRGALCSLRRTSAPFRSSFFANKPTYSASFSLSSPPPRRRCHTWFLAQHDES